MRCAGPAVEPMMHMASSDEDEPLAAGVGGGSGGGASGSGTTATGATATASNHLGHEIAEDEGLYQFRRSKTCQYHKVSGDWQFFVFLFFCFNCQ